MFKAISRWSSQVRSSLGIGFISNLFSSKSKSKYGEMCEDTEEIFSDTHEEPFTDDEDDHKVVIEVTEPLKTDPVTAETDSDKSTDGSLTNTAVDQLDSAGAVTDSPILKQVSLLDFGEESDAQTDQDTCLSENIKANGNASGVIVLAAVDSSQETKGNDGDSSSSCDSDNDDKSDEDDSKHEHTSEHEHSDDDVDHDHHHVHHDDTKQIVKSPSSKDIKQNGLPNSSSSGSIFKKVHRRVNSYSQRQYAKFDNTQDDENDNIITADVDVVDAKATSMDNKDVDQIIVINEKKTKKKKKVALFSFIRGFFRRTNT